MPILSKKSFTRPSKLSKTFKPPLNYTENISKLLNNNVAKSVPEKKKKTISLTVSFDAETTKKRKDVNVTKIPLTPEDIFSSQSHLDLSDADSVLSKDVLNRKDVKEKYLEFWNESLSPEEEDELISLTQEIQNDVAAKKVKPIKKTKQKQVDYDESFYEKMRLLHESRNVGVYVYCDSCDKLRYLPDVKDPLDLPDKWYCWLNPDDKYNKCEIEEEYIDKEKNELMILNKYNAGSIVWAKLEGYPWWPAMVEDDPDVEDYFWLEGDSLEPTYYHVTFFDSAEVTRSWIKTNDLKPFAKHIDDQLLRVGKFDKFKHRIDESFRQATEAIGMQLIDRLKKYSFIQRYKKPSKKAKRQRNAPDDGGDKKKWKRINMSED